MVELATLQALFNVTISRNGWMEGRANYAKFHGGVYSRGKKFTIGDTLLKKKFLPVYVLEWEWHHILFVRHTNNRSIVCEYGSHTGNKFLASTLFVNSGTGLQCYFSTQRALSKTLDILWITITNPLHRVCQIEVGWVFRVNESVEKFSYDTEHFECGDNRFVKLAIHKAC